MLFGNGDGSFQAPPLFHLPGTAFALAAADLDGDARADLVGLYYGGYGGASSVAVVLDPAARTAGALASYPSFGIPRNIVIADLDRDGNLDALTTDVYYNSVDVLFGRGDGTFAPPFGWQLRFAALRPGRR